MDMETIDNQFDTRTGTLLRYYTGLLEAYKDIMQAMNYMTVKSFL